MTKYFRLARNMALKSPSRFRLGAVLVNGSIISTGFNLMGKTHPLVQKYNHLPFTVGIHAEIHACLGVPIADLRGAKVYVYRVLRNGDAALAKPCKICQRFLISVGISKVHYSTGTSFEVMEF